MTGAIAGLLLNVLIVALLAVTIGYCWVLNKRIQILQDSKSELAQLFEHFDESTKRASESILALQAASKKISENMQTRIEKANFALDDLSYLLDKADKAIDKLEAAHAVNRARGRVQADSAPPVEEPVFTAQPVAPEPEKPQPRLRTAAALEAVLEKIMGRKGEESQSQAEREEASRSRAEQELLAMLKTGMKG